MLTSYAFGQRTLTCSAQHLRRCVCRPHRKSLNFQNTIMSLRAIQEIAPFVRRVTDWTGTADVDTATRTRRAAPKTIRTFIEDRVKAGKKPATIRRYVATVSRV